MTKTIRNITIAADTEIAIQLPAGTVRFAWNAREATDVQYSFTSGTTDSKYRTLKSGEVYSSWGMNVPSGGDLYFVRASSIVNIELETWSN